MSRFKSYLKHLTLLILALLMLAGCLSAGMQPVPAQENVEIQSASNLWWIGLIVVLAAAAIILPLSLRNRRRRMSSYPAQDAPVPVPSGADADKTGVFPAGLGTAGPGVPVLIETRGAVPGRSWPLNRPEVRLGRKRDENDIPLYGLSASRRHAVIRQVNNQYIIYTLNPQNPVLVNGQPAPQPVPLCPGDTIQAGESAFRFEETASR